MKIYTAGPMTGHADLNFPAFHRAAAQLRALGHEVVNPAEMNIGLTEWADCMRNDIKALVDCEAIALLPGWDKSRGSQLEHRIASALGLRVFSLSQLLVGGMET